MIYTFSGQGCRFRARQMIDKLLPHQMDLVGAKRYTPGYVDEVVAWCHNQYGDPAINLNLPTRRSNGAIKTVILTQALWALCGDTFYFRRPELVLEFKMRWG